MKNGGMLIVVLLLLAGAGFALSRRTDEEIGLIDLPNVFEVTTEPEVGDSIAWMVDRPGAVVLVIFLKRTAALNAAVKGMASVNPGVGFVMIPDRFADAVAGGGAAGVDRFCEAGANLAIAVGAEFGDPAATVTCFGPGATAEDIAGGIDPLLPSTIAGPVAA